MAEEVSARLVFDLRKLTGAPMMACKKALVEAQGDLEAAEQILRVNLGAKVSKAAGRVATEGMVAAFVSEDARVATLVELNCETDFVARNPEFIEFAECLAALVGRNDPEDVPAAEALPHPSGGTVAEFRENLISRMGENIGLRRFVRFVSKDRVSAYVHGAKIGVLVENSSSAEAGKDIAMHIAALKPLCVSQDQVPAEKVERERQVFLKQAAGQGKPEEIVKKMVEGRVQKYLTEVALLEQPFVKDTSVTIKQMLKREGGSVQRFCVFIVGEGLEAKQTVDFAAEVAAQVSASSGCT